MSTLRAFTGQHFAFAAGRSTVLKQFLLTSSDVDRLLGSHSLVEFERTMGELKLFSAIDRTNSSPDALLRAVESWVLKEVTTMTPVAKRPVFGILFLAGDAPRLSYLLKKYHGLTSDVSHEPVTTLSFWDADELQSAVETGKTVVLPTDLMTFISAMRTKNDITAAAIDRAVASFVTERRLALARASGSSDITRYVRHLIDITNIRTALRFPDGLADATALLAGGALPLARLQRGPKETLAAIAASELYAPFAHSARSSSTDTPMDIEHIGSRILADDIARMWTVPLTVEPVFAFAAMVIADVRLLRAILIGKRNGLSPQDIKGILPPFIPASHYAS